MNASAYHFTAASAQARHNRAMLEEHLRAEIAGELDATLATMTDAPYLLPGTGLAARGLAAVTEVYRTRFRDVPDQAFEVVRSVVTDDVAVIEGYLNATPHGLFFGLQGHGKRVRLRAAVWIEFRDGKLAGERGYYDTAELQRQLVEGID